MYLDNYKKGIHLTKFESIYSEELGMIRWTFASITVTNHWTLIGQQSMISGKSYILIYLTTSNHDI